MWCSRTRKRLRGQSAAHSSGTPPPPVTHGPYLFDGDEEGGGGGGGEGEVGARAEVDGDGADCEANTTVAWREGVCGGGESEGDSGGAGAATEEAS